MATEDDECEPEQIYIFHCYSEGCENVEKKSFTQKSF